MRKLRPKEVEQVAQMAQLVGVWGAGIPHSQAPVPVFTKLHTLGFMLCGPSRARKDMWLQTSISAALTNEGFLGKIFL